MEIIGVVFLIIFAVCLVYCVLIRAFIKDWIEEKDNIIPNCKYKIMKETDKKGYYYRLFRVKYLHKSQMCGDRNLNKLIKMMKLFKQRDTELKKLRECGEDKRWLSDDEIMVEEL
jgi:hypothetical protein